MPTTQNKGLYFKSIPERQLVPGKHIVVEDHPIDLETVSIPSNGILAKTHYSSFDPYQRGRFRSPEIESYIEAYGLGEVVPNSGIVTVLRSENAKFQKGDVLDIWFTAPIQEYSVLPAEALGLAQKLDNPYKLDLTLFMGPLGMPGLTAYSSLYEIGQPKKGEVILVSAASGAVGQIVGQLAKREGLTVIGSVGDDAKLDFITKKLGFDSGFNYKKEKPADALKRLAPKGIDIYYENVGGELLEAAIGAMNTFGRIVASGMISTYDSGTDEYHVRNLYEIVAKRIKFQGFIVSDERTGPKYQKEHRERVSKWLDEGSIHGELSITDGIDNAAEGLVGLLQGKNFGKAILKIADLNDKSKI